MIDYYKVYNETKNLTVLYVEDDESFLKETRSVFSELFFRVDTAINGKDGLDKYKCFLKEENDTYDIVITDVNMPYINGIDLVKEIYSIKSNQPIIVISAHDESKYLLELLNLGIEQFLVKPIDFDILLKILFELVNKINQNQNFKSNQNIIKLKTGLLWNLNNKTLLKDEKIIKLTKKETFLMAILIKNGYKVSSFQEILTTIYDESQMISDNILKPLVSRLRKKVPELIIENVYGLGYRLLF